jgi:hypothetical protein
MQQAGQPTPSKPPLARSPLPPKTPQAPSALAAPPAALSPAPAAAPTDSVAAAAAAVAQLHAFPGSPPMKVERPARRSVSTGALGAGRAGSSSSMAGAGAGAKRSLSYQVEGGSGEVGGQEAASAPALHPQQQAQQVLGGRKRRKVARPARAADT